MAVHLDGVMSSAARAIEVLGQYASVSAAYLFGSHVDGTAGPDSDIDLAAFIEGEEQWDVRQSTRVIVLVQREVGDDIELHFFPATALKNPEPASFAAYVQEHGIEIRL
jgi:predicted nucleotidyltransferase